VSLAAGDIDALFAGLHDDPFRVLGLHDGPDGLIATALVIGADDVAAFGLAGEPGGSLPMIDQRGLFQGPVSFEGRRPVKYRARARRWDADAEWWVTDPYSFGPVLGPIDDYLMAEGSHARLFDKMGAHRIEHEGARGFHFAVWAPNARRVSVTGSFNDWDGRRNAMRLRRDTGVWETFIPDIGEGAPYKFEIVAADGVVLPLKADPFAFRAERRPANASVTSDPPPHAWGDGAHLAHWASVEPRRAPISIYEVHAGSWRRAGDGGFLAWDEMADQLIPYVVDMGFTHIEFLPISEHPLDASWGYQTTGLYAPTARFGDPQGFARFVDGAHRAGIGVILDWVPAHFPTDAHGLAQFDGTALYEHADPRLGHHPDWNTAIFNYGRREVAAYLINNAVYWSERYHVDALRVDAVASMLYRDYSRPLGEWIPNEHGGRENWEAVDFLRRMNAKVYDGRRGVFTIAEESTAWPGVCQPVHEGGLGFGFKWNMGFMNDTLAYMARDPVHRRFHHRDITFGLIYAFSENFVLPLSHDEVVHGKGSLLTRMAGGGLEKFANLRAYLAMMWGYPGKKLLFMGQEFAQRREWDEDRALDWELLGAPAHAGVRALVRDLNGVYRANEALHGRDCEAEGFEWLIADDTANSVFAWLRRGAAAAPVAVIAHMTPVLRTGYRAPLRLDGVWREIINSDSQLYGGGGVGNLGHVIARGGAATLTLPPLSTILLRFEG
jgi:1,4-alpha-glucan branching enzyme